MSTNQREGLWKMGYGKIGACLGALDKQGVTIEQFGKLDSDEELAKQVAQIFTESIKEMYADEEVNSSYGYPDGYTVKSVSEQLKLWKKYLPELSTDGVLEEAAYLCNLPDGAEDLFVIPKWERVAGTYGKAVEKMLAILASNRKFHNYRKGELGTDYLRLSQHTADYLEKLARVQTGDFLVIPAQFGLKHRGKSVRRARAMFADNEFGLGSFAVAAMLITHPDRLTAYEDLFIDCAGDEYAPFAGGDWSYAPIFYFNDGQLEFCTYWSDSIFAYYGSASGFLLSQ